MRTKTFVHSGITAKPMVSCGLFITLTFVSISFINIRLPLIGNGGLIHLGNVPLFLPAIICGKKTGAVAGVIVLPLADVLKRANKNLIREN